MEGDKSRKTPSGVWSLLTAVLLLLTVGEAKAESQSSAPADNSQSAALEPVVHPLNESNFVVGHNFSLICKIPKRGGETAFSWITPNKDKVPSVETKLLNVSGDMYQTSRVTIQNASSEDSGQYICNVWIGDHVNSSYPYEVQVQTQMAQYLSGGNVALPKTHVVVLEENTPQYAIQCRAKGSPSSRITWTKNGLPLTAAESGPGIRRGGHEVFFFSVQQDDAGLYECQVENRDGTVNASVTIQVIKPVNKTGKTKTLKETVDLFIREDTKNFSIQCHVNASDPPQIIWTKDGHAFSSSGRPEGPKISEDGIEITFPVVTLADRGLYKCAAKGHPGRVIDVISIEVAPGPNWTNRLCGIFIIVVLLFLFVVSMATQSCCSKVACCLSLDVRNLYTTMNEGDSRRSSQHAVHEPKTGLP